VVFKLKPRNDLFFAYFDQLADAIVDAASLLLQFIEQPGDSSQKLESINRVEERGDNLLSEVMVQINSSFVTPFDREDILQLARGLNSIVDHTQGTMEKIVIYKAGRPKEIYILKLAQVLEEAAEEIKAAVSKLSDIRNLHQEVVEASERIRNYEHEGDYLYRAGIALLFENTENVVDIIKWKEIYEHLETTLDYCEDVSNIIKGIAVKYV
jgi:predicted phosphate transport protein (TIGR00153 family)